MSKKRIVRWAIVLFLLLALPVMTVALAQGKEPVGKQLPVVTEPSESQSPESLDDYESESNNTRASADQYYLGFVMGGKIGQVGDIDYFKFSDSFAEYFLIDIDAGNNLDSVVCLLDSAGNEIECNDDSDGADSLLFVATTLVGNTYYVTVTDHYGDGASQYFDYKLIITVPVMVSAAPAGLGTGTVAGIPFQSGDVLAWCDLYVQPDKWLMFFDASDVGVNTLSNVAFGTYEWYGDSMLFSVGAAQTIPGIGKVKPHDILSFKPGDDDEGRQAQYGAETIGSIEMVYRGSEINLTTASEKLDALDGPALSCGYDLPLSTTGLATYSSYSPRKQDDEDVFCLYWEDLGEPITWRWFFDVNGLNDGPFSRTIKGLPAEDVFGVSVIESYDRIALNILGSGKILNHNVNQKDIFSIHLSDNTWGGYLWRGPQHGWNYNLDAFEMSDYLYLVYQNLGPEMARSDSRP